MSEMLHAADAELLRQYQLDKFFPGVSDWKVWHPRTPTHLDIFTIVAGVWHVKILLRPNKRGNRIAIRAGSHEGTLHITERWMECCDGDDEMLQEWLRETWPLVVGEIRAAADKLLDVTTSDAALLRQP